jgi:hypothetical protein
VVRHIEREIALENALASFTKRSGGIQSLPDAAVEK